MHAQCIGRANVANMHVSCHMLQTLSAPNGSFCFCSGTSPMTFPAALRNDALADNKGDAPVANRPVIALDLSGPTTKVNAATAAPAPPHQPPHCEQGRKNHQPEPPGRALQPAQPQQPGVSKGTTAGNGSQELVLNLRPGSSSCPAAPVSVAGAAAALDTVQAPADTEQAQAADTAGVVCRTVCAACGACSAVVLLPRV